MQHRSTTKKTVEESEHTGFLLPSENKARLLAGYTSPVEITGSWIQEESVWKCKAKRLWRMRTEYSDFTKYQIVEE